MKNIILICMLVSLLACVKVQKKSDLEKPEVQSIPIQSIPVEVEPERQPVIFSLDEVISLTQDTLIVADQVYLNSNTRIYTNQFSLEINATSIYIERGVFIQTFPESGLRAETEVPGLNGGVVHIVANDIHGNLQALMNGQIGGTGLAGWLGAEESEGMLPMPAKPPCAPNSGKNSGTSGSFFLEVNHSQDFSITTSMKTAEGGAIGQVFPTPYSFLSPKQSEKTYKKYDKVSCFVTPTTGQPGHPGQICLKLSETELPRCERF